MARRRNSRRRGTRRGKGKWRQQKLAVGTVQKIAKEIAQIQINKNIEKKTYFRQHGKIFSYDDELKPDPVGQSGNWQAGTAGEPKLGGFGLYDLRLHNGGEMIHLFSPIKRIDQASNPVTPNEHLTYRVGNKIHITYATVSGMVCLPKLPELKTTITGVQDYCPTNYENQTIRLQMLRVRDWRRQYSNTVNTHGKDKFEVNDITKMYKFTDQVGADNTVAHKIYSVMQTKYITLDADKREAKFKFTLKNIPIEWDSADSHIDTTVLFGSGEPVRGNYVLYWESLQPFTQPFIVGTESQAEINTASAAVALKNSLCPRIFFKIKIYFTDQ